VKPFPPWSFPYTEPGAVPIENLGIHRSYHKQVHLWAGHAACIWWISRHRAPNAACCRGGGIAMEPRPFNLLVANDQVILAQCEGVLMAWLESPLGAESGLAEASPQAHQLEGLYIARTLARDSRDVPVRVLNATRHDQLMKVSSQAQWASYAGGPNRFGTTTGPSHYS
jgi:hypothetical protein